MKKLKIFDAVKEVFCMDELQLKWQRKNGWKYLHQAIRELQEKIENKSINNTSILGITLEPVGNDKDNPFSSLLSICNDCDVIDNPVCNKCIGS